MNGSGMARTLSRLWMLLVAVTAISVLYLAKVLALPLAFAILFAFLLAPVVGFLERLRFARVWAALVVMLAFVTLLSAIGWFFFTQLVAVANDLPIYRDNIAAKIEALHRPNDSAYGRAEREIQRISDELGIANSTAAPPQPARNGKKALGTTPDHPVQVKEVNPEPHRLGQLGGMLEILTTAFLSVVFTFFVILQKEDLRNRLIRLSGDRNVSMVTQAMTDASRRISRYFSLELLVNTVYATIVCVGLYFIGLPHALLFGALAGLLRFVPYVGAPIAGLLPTALSLAVFHGWSKSAMILAMFFCLEVVTANYAEPRIYGRHTGLSSLAILVAAAFWTLIWGPVGLVLSVPLTVCLVVMGRHVPQLEFLSVMLGDQPPISRGTWLYQRLIAHDGREAAEVLEKQLIESRLETVYDEVLVPALILSEQDRIDDNLDESTLRFVRRTARDLIEELGFRENGEAEQGMQARSAPRVMCVPVRDETDELAALMLAQCLSGPDLHAYSTPVQRIEQLVARAGEDRPDVVVLCGLPPVGMARSHRVYRLLRARHPKATVMVGMWNSPEDPEESARKIGDGEGVQVFTRIADAVQALRETLGIAIPERPRVAAEQGQSAA